MSKAISNNKRLAKNSLVLYIRMLFTMVIQLYTSRLVLKALGVEDYGIYNVVGGVVLLLNSINASLSNANARFIAVEIGAGTQNSLNRLYSCIITIHYIFALAILIIAETIGLWFVSHKLVIPETRLSAALWVYQGAVFASIITIVSSPYTGLLIAHEKMSALAFISIFDAIAKLLIALFLFIYPFDKLIIYSILVVIVNSAVRAIYTIYCRRNFEESSYKLLWDKYISKKVLSFAGWTLTGNIAVTGSTQGLNILLNIFFGAVVNAARGIAVQVQAASRMFVSGFQTAINPQIIKSYSQNDLKRMSILINLSSRFSYYLMLLIAIPVCLHTKYILTVWLGSVPDFTTEFVQIMLAIALINTLQNPTMIAIHATGNIKTVQIVESLLLISIVPIAYILLKIFHISPIMVFGVYFIIEFITQFVRVIMVYPKVHIPIKDYMLKVILPISLVSVVAIAICWHISSFFAVKNIIELAFTSLIYILITSITILLLGLKKQEQLYILDFINARIRHNQR